MNITKPLTLALICLCFMLGSMSDAFAKFPEANQKVRDTAVAEKLKASPRAVLLYAKGMCCPSCAIGIRRTISRLDFVDTTASESGILLDAEHQLVAVTMKQNAKPNLRALADALNDAGYEPVHAYTMKKGKVVTASLSAPSYRVVP